MQRLFVVLCTSALGVVLSASAATADEPSRVRDLACSDGTTFTAEQVRFGLGKPPHAWRNVVPGAQPAVFSFHAASVVAPDGTVVQQVTWDQAQGVDRQQELVTCSFIIPIGEFAGYSADFVGFFVAE